MVKYAFFNKQVSSLDMNVAVVSANRMLTAREFQKHGPATEKARSPVFDFVIVKSSLPLTKSSIQELINAKFESVK